MPNLYFILLYFSITIKNLILPLSHLLLICLLFFYDGNIYEVQHPTNIEQGYLTSTFTNVDKWDVGSFTLLNSVIWSIDIERYNSNITLRWEYCDGLRSILPDYI